MRLETVLTLAGRGRVFADVCADHGRLGIAAVHAERFERAILVDQAEAPCALARQNVVASGYAARVEVRVGDGLGALAGGEADVASLAGIGGRLAVRILDRAGPGLRALRRVVVQPNKRGDQVRRWLSDNGWRIADEALVDERGRVYEVIAAERGTEPLDDVACYLGPVNLRRGGGGVRSHAERIAAWLAPSGASAAQVAFAQALRDAAANTPE